MKASQEQFAAKAKLQVEEPTLEDDGTVSEHRRRSCWKGMARGGQRKPARSNSLSRPSCRLRSRRSKMMGLFLSTGIKAAGKA